MEYELDFKKFLSESLNRIRSDVDFCYPYNELQLSRCHAMLQKIDGEAATLLGMLKNISIKPEIK